MGSVRRRNIPGPTKESSVGQRDEECWFALLPDAISNQTQMKTKPEVVVHEK